MNILFSPTKDDRDITYEFNNEVITVTIDGTSDIFDFGGVPEGVLNGIETELPVNPIEHAERINGTLNVKLIYFCKADDTYEENFPEEFDSETRPFVTNIRDAEEV